MNKKLKWSEHIVEWWESHTWHRHGLVRAAIVILIVLAIIAGDLMIRA